MRGLRQEAARLLGARSHFGHIAVAALEQEEDRASRRSVFRLGHGGAAPWPGERRGASEAYGGYAEEVVLVLLFLPLLLFNEFPGLVRDIDNESESDGEQRQDVERCSEYGESFHGLLYW